MNITVRNNGETAISEININLTGHSLIIREINLAPGETKVLVVDAELDKLGDDGLCIVEVLADGDDVPENNSNKITLGIVDVGLTVSQYLVGGNIFITAELSNNSETDAETTLVVRKNGLDGENLAKEKKLTITTSANTTIYYQFNPDDFDDDLEQVYIAVQTEKADANYFDNDAAFPVYKDDAPDPIDPIEEIHWIPAEGVEISGENALIRNADEPENNSGEQLTAKVTPADATNKEVFWLSSDESIVYVDSEGILTLRAPGTVEITALTKDGDHRDSIEITVTDNAYALAIDRVVGGYATVNDGLKLFTGCRRDHL
jgi:hypothetical protein